MLIFILTRLINRLNVWKSRLTYIRDKLAYKAYLGDKTFKEIRLKAISKSERCEICHQSDLFNAETEECERCKNINIKTTSFNIFTPDIYTTRKELIDQIAREKENEEKERLTLTSAEIKKIEVEYEDGIKDTLQATVDDYYDSSYHAKRRSSPYGAEIKSAIQTAVNQLGINPKRKEYYNYTSNHAYNDAWVVIDLFDSKDEKPFLKLSPYDWVILDVLFNSMDSVDNKYRYSLFDEEKIFRKSEKYTLVLSEHTRKDHEKKISYGMIRQSLNNLQYKLKAVNHYNHRFYNTLYGTSYKTGDYFIINDYGVRLVLLKNEIIKMNPWFFDFLYEEHMNKDKDKDDKNKAEWHRI